MSVPFADVLQYLYSSLPMYQRVGANAFKKDLTNTLALCQALGNPHTRFKSIHVAGTNGKGSSSHMLASILQEAGYKTGLYTSPHLKSFTERIRINGKEVPETFVIDFVNRMRNRIDHIKPSFFETTVAMAFDYFAQQHVEIAVIEVGLGGRLDSTNVITPVVSLITNIGYDHTDMLGETLEQIAFEKAGIIKPGVPVVISERQEKTTPVFLKRADECHAPVFFAQDDYQITQNEKGYEIRKNGNARFTHIHLPLGGKYQIKNLCGVIKVTEVLSLAGFRLSEQHIYNGLEKVVVNTSLKGRWQVLNHSPLIICDTAHNAEGLTEVVNQLEAIAYNRLFIVLGLVKDKDHEKILSLLPPRATYFFCQASIPRALAAQELAQKAAHYGLAGEVVPDVNRAIAFAREKATPNDLIFIGGSTFVVAEINDL